MKAAPSFKRIHLLQHHPFLTLFSLQNHRVTQFSSVQSLSRVRLFATPWTAARQASLSITNSRSPPKPMSTVSVMPSNHLILCRFPSPPAPNLSQHQLCHTAGVLCRTTTGTRLLGLRTFSAICDSDPGQFNLAYPPYHHILNGNHNTLLRGMRVK